MPAFNREALAPEWIHGARWEYNPMLREPRSRLYRARACLNYRKPEEEESRVLRNGMRFAALVPRTERRGEDRSTSGLRPEEEGPSARNKPKRGPQDDDPRRIVS